MGLPPKFGPSAYNVSTLAMRHGSRMLVLRDGGLVYDGTPDHEIYSLMEQVRRI